MDIFDDMRSKLNANAVQELDRFQNKYTERMKNTMYGLICHAYNRGLKDGKKDNQSSYNKGKEDGASEMLNVVRSIVLSQDDYIFAFPFKETIKAFNTDDPYQIFLHYEAPDILNKADEITKGMSESKNETYEIQPGDEVAWVDNHGMMSTGNRFIVTDIEPGNFISGISVRGGTHFHSVDEGSDITRWKKTGRHVDILGFLDQLKECKDGGQG
jgi:hypothetical protein